MMSKLATNSRIERPQSRWVGQPVDPQNERGESPGGRQKHYGAVKLPGVGEQIYVNDVVQVLPKHNSGGSEKERFHLTQLRKSVRGSDTALPLEVRPSKALLLLKYSKRPMEHELDTIVLAIDRLECASPREFFLSALQEVLSMWEDTFTGVFKFRARLLMHASELPRDVLSRLCAARRTFSNGIRSSKHDKRCGDGETEYNEVFLTPRMEDLEVRLIVRSVTLSETPSPETAIPVELEEKMGPRLTHTYDDSTGDFAPVDDDDPIFKHARVRESKAVDTASRANQEHDTTENDYPVKSTGWLLPKRSVFNRKRRGEIGSHCHRGLEVKNGSHSYPVSPVHVGSPVSAIGMSKDSELEVGSNSKNGERKEGVDCDDEGTSTDNDLRGSSKQITTVKGGFMPKKSARQLKSQRFSDNNAGVNSHSFVASFCSTPMFSSSSQRHSRASASTEARFLPLRPRRLDMPPVSEGGQQVAVPDSEGDACTTTVNQLKTKQSRPLSIRGAGEAQAKNSRKLPRSSSSGSPMSAVKRSKVSCKRRMTYTNTTTKITSTYANGGFPGKMTHEESGYPPRHTPVGKEFQTEIPDLLSYEERKRASTGTSARMVWRSIRDWDARSRGMLAEYLHATKEVVQKKQARPGVAVHVRLGGISVGVDLGDGHIDSTDRTGSYAVWAVTTGRHDTCDVVRVACSEMAQTEVPRSAIQRVQCEEEALAALVNTRCILDDFDPALDLLAKPSSGPQSVEQWTLNQVRTLERALHDEFDPKRRLHGWARPGMAMDREDFIDLATVSKHVPGKTPAQVLAFYYRYLTAAEPLTDVVYGPKAAEARRQEKAPPDCEVDKPDYLGGGPARGSRRTANLRAGSTQTLDGSQRASPGNLRKGVPSESGSDLPKRRLSSSESQVLRLPSPKPSQEHILKASKTDVDHSTATDTSVRHIGYAEAESPLCQATIGKYGSGAGKCRSGLTAPNLPVPRSNRSSHGVDGMTSAGCDFTEGPFDRNGDGDDNEGGHCARNKTTSGAHAVLNNDVNCNPNGGRARHSAIQHGKGVRYKSTDSSSDRPPAAEIFEVQDSDEEKRSQQVSGGDRRRTSPFIPDAKALLHKFVVKAAATHPNTLGPQGLKRVARHMLSPSAGPVPAPTIQPPTTDSVWPRSGAHKGSSMERPRTGRVTNTPYAIPIREAGLTEVQGHASWDRRSAPRSNHHDPHIRRHDRGYMYGFGGSGTPELGTALPDNNVQQTLEKAPIDDIFGVMAPCWRLLERAKSYMDKDQLVYMRELILLHAKKPMSRDQLLERAENCLQEQGHIFAAFAKMFDRISQPPSAPLYPTKKKEPGPSPSSGRRQVMSYTSPYALPATVPEHPGSVVLYSSAPRTFRGETWEHKTVSPSDVSICSAAVSHSPHGRESSYPRLAAGKPGGVWCPPRLGGGSDGLVQYLSGRDPSVMPISEYSRREAPNLTYAFCDGGVASCKVGTQQGLHRPLHQPSQWRVDFRNASAVAMAAAEEATKRDEPGGRSA